MNAETTISGRRVTRHPRAPKTAAGGRTCTQDDCDTKLSRYNRHDTCWAHAPTRYPRSRGRASKATE
jgi:hypothetical protein